MLHELLFALHGYPGDVFILNDEMEIQVTNAVSICSPAEKEILNRLCNTASSYYKITNFQSTVMDYLEISKTFQSGPQQGLYIVVLCDGIGEVLQPYREALITLEKEILNEPFGTLLHIQASLNDFRVLFFYLIRLINDVIKKEVTGCKILGLIYSYSYECSVPFVNKALKLLLRRGIGVMINQLHSFLIYGIITDYYKEFFVQKLEPSDPAKGNLNDKSSNSKTANKSAFMIKRHMVPTFISPATADAILFIGETNFIFSTHREQLQDGKLILQSKELEFSKSLFQLEETDYNFFDLQEVIEKMRNCVAEQLWEIIVKSSDLISHLHALKDLYLLGRGELFLTFLDQASHLMNKTPSTCIEHDIKTEFQKAIWTFILEEETCFQKFRLTLKDTSTKFSKKGNRLPETWSSSPSNSPFVIWDCIMLEYSPPEILKLLFTPEILQKYNSIFRFLLYIRNVQLELQRCWAIQMSGHHRKLANSKQWHLRSCMAFIVDNLQYYLQVDVLECQFHDLLQKINATRDFEKIEIAHVAFVNNILMQTFISITKVFQTLNGFLNFCLIFCEEVKKTPDLNEQQLDNFKNTFDNNYARLVIMMTLISEHAVSPYLSQLLLKLDFNDYFKNRQKIPTK